MKNEWMVSVLTPVHETPLPLVQRAFRSLESQSFGFDRIQWVVVLHNCTQGYKEEVASLLRKYPNVFCSTAEKEHTSVSYARNATLDRAQGKYLFFLDSDDEMKADCIREVVQEMEGCGADTGIFASEITGGDMPEFWLDADPAGGSVVFCKGDPGVGKSMCLGGLHLWMRCYRRSLIADNKLRFDESLGMGEDFLFNAAATGKAERLVLMPQVLGYTHYAGIGVTRMFYSYEEMKSDSASAGLFFDVASSRYLGDLYKEGLRAGLDLSNVIWRLSAIYGLYVLASKIPYEEKRKFVQSLKLLISLLSPPGTMWEKRQKVLDKDYAFVQGVLKIFPPVRLPCDTLAALD